MNEVKALVAAFDAANVIGERCALAIVVSVEGSSYRRPGARMLITESGSSTGTISAGCLESDVVEHAKRVMRARTPQILEYDTTSTTDEIAWGLGLGCNGIVRVLVEPLEPDSRYIDVLRHSCERDAVPVLVEHNIAGNTFIETVMPPVPLVLFGAEQDALPIVDFARTLGWHIEVVDLQAREASRPRFARADKVTLARPADIATSVVVTERTMALIMSHNYSIDQAVLEFLLNSPVAYIGVMGPRARTERMLSEIDGIDNDSLTRLHSPVGLDLGATGPTEVALSIVAEIRAVLEKRQGGMLRNRQGPIHAMVTV